MALCLLLLLWLQLPKNHDKKPWIRALVHGLRGCLEANIELWCLSKKVGVYTRGDTVRIKQW